MLRITQSIGLAGVVLLSMVFWYDLGYFFGASAFLGGSSTAGARRGR